MLPMTIVAKRLLFTSLAQTQNVCPVFCDKFDRLELGAYVGIVAEWLVLR
jgi:hypothetical protein